MSFDITTQITEKDHIPKRPVFTFNEILESNDYVLCDTSITGIEKGDWYWDSIYPVHRFSELDIGEIENKIRSIKSFNDFLMHLKVFVTGGVSRETFTIISLLADKIKFLSWRKGLTKRDGKLRREIEEESTEESVLKEIYNSFFESYVLTKRFRFEFPHGNNGAYNFLEKIVLNVAEHTHAKIDYEEVYHPNRRPKKVEDFHTDEQLVATALYLSVVEEKSCGILTRDSDIRRILYHTLSYLTYYHEHERPKYREILQSIKRWKIKVYHNTDVRSQLAELDYNSFKFNHKKRIGIKSKTLDVIESQINFGTH